MRYILKINTNRVNIWNDKKKHIFSNKARIKSISDLVSSISHNERKKSKAKYSNIKDSHDSDDDCSTTRDSNMEDSRDSNDCSTTRNSNADNDSYSYVSSSSSSSSVQNNPRNSITNYLSSKKIAHKWLKNIECILLLECSGKEYNIFAKVFGINIDFSVPDLEISLVKNITTVKNDKIPHEWAIDCIKVSELWDENIRGKDTCVAIFDTGIDINHEQLSKNYSGISRDFVNSSDKIYDDNGNGTSICGLICSKNVNGFNIGVAPNTKWISCKILDQNGSGYLSFFLEACDFILDGNKFCNVIHCCFSLHTFVNSNNEDYGKLFSDVIDKLSNNKIYLCFPCGNWGEETQYPNYLKNVFLTGSHDIDFKISKFTEFGYCSGAFKPDIVCPGENILTCVFNKYLPGKNNDIIFDNNKNPYKIVSGTSYASAYLAGSILLLMECLTLREINYNFTIIKSILNQQAFRTSQNVSVPCIYSVVDDVVHKRYNPNNKDMDEQDSLTFIQNLVRPVPKIENRIADKLNPKFCYLDISTIYFGVL